METTTYLFTQISFVAVTLVFYLLILRELRKGLAATDFPDARKKKVTSRTLLALAGWMIFTSVLSVRGFFSDFSAFPPRIGIVLIIPLITMIIVSFSNTTREILRHIPAVSIVRLQVFRVFVELLLWALLLQNLLPVQMSFEGRNFDILAGLTAPIIAFLYSKNLIGRTALRVWNILGLATLLNIVVIAVLSMPTPFRVFMNEPSNTIVTMFPIVWLPGFLVPLAYSLHFFSLRQLSVKDEKRVPGNSS